ncbi:MAG: sulfur carrier protein ThiS [Candidatus Latescibacterota bacterium]
MQILVNGDKTDIDGGATLDKLIERLAIAHTRQGIAIAVNDAVVPRELWSTTILHQGDSIEIIRAVQGG